MKLAIISDIHANLEALEATVQDISRHEVDRIVCLGDIVGYNANPAECLALVQRIGALCVAGNHDRAVNRKITSEDFNRTAARAIGWTRRRLNGDALEYLSGLPAEISIGNHLVAVHGALHPDTGRETVRLDTDERRRLSFDALMVHPSGARICAFGHTHRLEIFELRDGTVQARPADEVILRDDAFYLVNPGSVGQPRDADRRATYLTVDFVRRVATAHRVEHDGSIPLAKTRRAGLLPLPAYLPKPVRKSLKWGVRMFGP